MILEVQKSWYALLLGIFVSLVFMFAFIFSGMLFLLTGKRGAKYILYLL